MNTGKSPTWFYYAGSLLDKYGIEYVMKIDTDSLLYLDRYFTFAENTLPPAPYNTRILAGAVVDKAGWKMDNTHSKQTEQLFLTYYNGVHLYAAGQMYIMSHDLVIGVAHVAASDKEMIHFAEGHEDHDVSTMAFLSLKDDEKDNPIKLVMIPHTDSFWKHPMKLRYGVSNWKEKWDSETARVKNLAIGHSEAGNHLNTFANSTLHENSSRDTSTIIEIPIVDKSYRSSWKTYLETNGTDDWIEDNTKVLDAVQINNSIAPTNTCFLYSGYLQRPLEMVQLTAPNDGGLQWDILMKFFSQTNISVNVDVIILSDMDVGMARSNNVHTIQLLAESLQLNFAWVPTKVNLAATTPVRNKYGFTGLAILSKCPMYDPYLVREFHDQAIMAKREGIGFNSGLFVRIASAATIATGTGYHIIAGSVSKLGLLKKRQAIWEYQFGYGPTPDSITGISPSNQLGSIIAGEIDPETCGQLGLKHLEPKRHLSYPAFCHNRTYGSVRADNVCSNLMPPRINLLPKRKAYTLYLPCYQLEQSAHESVIQLSNHSVIFAALH
jgi:Galactosyltransferase